MAATPALAGAVLALLPAIAQALAGAAMGAEMLNAVDPPSHAAILAMPAIPKAVRRLTASQEMRQHHAIHPPSRATVILTINSPQATHLPVFRRRASPLATATISGAVLAPVAVAQVALVVEATAPVGRVVLARSAAVRSWSGS